MATIQDDLPTAVAERRQEIIQRCAGLLDKTEQEISNLVVESKRAASEYIYEAMKFGCYVGLDFFHWHVDLALWKMATSDPFPYDNKTPDIEAEPYSAEYEDTYMDLLYREIRYGEEVKSHDLGRDGISDLSRGGFKLPKREHTASLSEDLTSKRQRTTGSMEVAPIMHPQLPAPLPSLPIPTPPTGGRPQPQPSSRFTPAPYSLETPTRFYVWPEGQAAFVWSKVFPGRNKLLDGGPFYFPFPCGRDRNECLVRRASRANELLNDRYVHVVWGRTTGPTGRHLGHNIFLSPVSSAVNIEDVAFLRAITLAWEMVVYWFGDMLTFSKDINLATFLEANFQSDLNRLRQQDNANAWNERIKQYEDMAREKVQAFQADKKAATDYITGLLYESPNFEARKGRIDEWVDSKQHSVIIKRRELAKMIWDDHCQQLADSRNAINEWFRSPRGAGNLVFRPRRVKREE